jgi:hypothetical protein
LTERTRWRKREEFLTQRAPRPHKAKLRQRLRSWQLEVWHRGHRYRADYRTKDLADAALAKLNELVASGITPAAAFRAVNNGPRFKLLQETLPRGSQEDWKEGYRRRMVMEAKKRAKKRGLPFSITVEDVPIPDRCPVLDIPLVPWEPGKGRTGSSPSIDRIIPELGYVRGNVAVISWKANHIKGGHTAAELRTVADWLSFAAVKVRERETA